MHRDTGAAFRALHERPGAFVIPNPWDVGSARFLAALGFEVPPPEPLAGRSATRSPC